MNILIVSPYYAPYSGVGASRMISLSKFLRDKGENVTVLCLSAETILRIEGAQAGLNTPVPEDIRIESVTLPTLTNNELIDNILHAKAFKSAIDILLNKYAYDLAIFSCGPFYTLSAATYLKRKYGVRYIVEFRDLGVLEEEKPQTFINRFKRQIILTYSRYIEKQCVIHSDKLVVVCPGDRDKMLSYYKPNRIKIEVIYNGFDHQSLQNIKTGQLDLDDNNTDTIYIGYFGKMMYYSKELALNLLCAVDAIRKKNINLKILHIGPENPSIVKEIEIRNLDKNCYICLGVKNYYEGMCLLKNINMSAIEYIHKTGLGTKIFDYIYLNKPIISLTPSNIPLSELVRRFENGFVCQTQKQIIDSIEYIITNNVKYLDTNIDLTQYSRSIQNENYYRLIKE